MAVSATLPECDSLASKLFYEQLVAKCGKKYPALMDKEEIAIDAPCLYNTVDEAVVACDRAQKRFVEMPFSQRYKIIAEIRSTAQMLAEDFALWAVSETRRGNYNDKVTKQHLSATKTPGPEDLTPSCVSGDHGMTITEYAPFGVIGAVTPVTNPTATIIHNSICMVSSGNGIIFNAHPAAMNCTNRAVAIINEVIKKCGGPESLVCAIRVPTIESGQQLLTHESTAANLVTGGPAVVKLALKSGKKCFCAGPGNPPVVVDETADIPAAAQSIYEGATFDNNMICSDEKEVFVVKSVEQELLDAFKKCGAYIATEEEISVLEKAVLREPCPNFTHGAVNVPMVGQSAAHLLKEILGVDVDENKCRLIVASVPDGHPFVYTELLMPILPVVGVDNFETAILCARRAEHGYRHTASIYSTNVHRITKMGKLINTSIFCINGNHLTGLASGGEGYTSFSITGYTGEGMTRPRTFVRERRVVCVGAFKFN